MDKLMEEHLKMYVVMRLADNPACKLSMAELCREIIGHDNIAIIKRGVRAHIGRAMRALGWQRRQYYTAADRQARGVYYNPPLHWEVSAWERGPGKA